LLTRWGDGKSTLWKQIKKCLNANFLQEDAQLLNNFCQLYGKSYLYSKAAENAKIPFNKAVERLASDPNVSKDAKKAWREKSEELPTAPMTFLEHLAWLFLCIFCPCQSCRKGYELDNDDNNGNDEKTVLVIQIKSQDARSRRMEMNATFFSVFLVSFSLIWFVYWPIYLVSTKMLVLILCIPFTNKRMSLHFMWGDHATKELLQG
jgi:hypothetical protein